MDALRKTNDYSSHYSFIPSMLCKSLRPGFHTVVRCCTTNKLQKRSPWIILFMRQHFDVLVLCNIWKPGIAIWLLSIIIHLTVMPKARLPFGGNCCTTSKQ